MELEEPKKKKKQTAQEAFKDLREKTKAEMLEKKQKLKAVHDKIVAKKAHKEGRKKDKDEEKDVLKKKESRATKEIASTAAKERKVEIQDTSERQAPHIETSSNKLPVSKPEHTGDSHEIKSELMQNSNRYRRRQGRCTNCCGGLSGQGPGAPRGGCVGQSCCNSASRLRGGSDDSRWSQEDPSEKLKSRSSSVPPGKSAFPRAPRIVRELGCSSGKSVELEKVPAVDSFAMCSVDRSRGGCGGCGGSPQSAPERFHRSQVVNYQRDSRKLMNHRSCLPQPPPSCQPCPPVPPCERRRDLCAKNSSTSTKGCCPCGGCGGAACSDNPGGGGQFDGGCCGGSRLQGLPCKCKCQSCSSCRPLGGCGGQSCGRIYSCAGSGGGRCCFPRNYKRRSGADCCGGADPNCGGCC